MGGRKEKWEGEGWKHGTREVGRKRGRDGSREKGKEGASESTLTVGFDGMTDCPLSGSAILSLIILCIAHLVSTPHILLSHVA